MIKLFITDLDGTLISGKDAVIPEELRRRLGKILSAGGNVAVASGRTYHSMSRLFREYGESIYYITCDGVLCIRNGRTLYHRPISDESVRRAYAAARERGLSLLLSSAQFGYAFGDSGFMQMLSRENTDDIISAEGLSAVKAPIYKIAFYGEGGNFTTVPADLRRSYHGGGWTEYVYRYADKGTALSDLQHRLYLTKYDTAAAGDGANDIPMLRNARYAFALGERAMTEGAERFLSISSVFDRIDEINGGK